MRAVPTVLPPELLDLTAIQGRVARVEQIRVALTRRIRGFLDELDSLESLAFELRPERVEEKRAAARQALVEETAGAVRELDQIKVELEAQQPHYSRRAVLARQAHAPDPLAAATIGSFWIARLAAASLAELVEVARHAGARRILPLLEDLRREADRRGLVGEDRTTVDLTGVCPLPFADAEAAKALLVGIEAADQAAGELYQAAAGGGDPGRKIELGLRSSARRQTLARELGEDLPPAA